MKKFLEKLSQRSIPMPYVVLAGAVGYVFVIRSIDVAIALLFAWLNVDNLALIAGLGSSLGFLAGFLAYHFTAGRQARHHIDRQAKLLNRTIDIWNELIARRNDSPPNHRVDGDQWKDG